MNQELLEFLQNQYKLSCDIQIKEINDFQNKNILSSSIINHMLRAYQTQMLALSNQPSSGRGAKAFIAPTSVAELYFKNIKFFDSQFDFLWKSLARVTSVLLPIFLPKSKEYILLQIDKKLFLITQHTFVQDAAQTVYPITQHIGKYLEAQTIIQHEEF